MDIKQTKQLTLWFIVFFSVAVSQNLLIRGVLKEDPASGDISSVFSKLTKLKLLWFTNFSCLAFMIPASDWRSTGRLGVSCFSFKFTPYHSLIIVISQVCFICPSGTIVIIYIWVSVVHTHQLVHIVILSQQDLFAPVRNIYILLERCRSNNLRYNRILYC